MESPVFKNIIRLAVIDNIDYANQIVSIKYIDRPSQKLYQCPLPHPSVFGNGNGIFVKPVKGTLVAVSHTYREAPIIVSYLPISSFAKDLTDSANTSQFFYNYTQYPSLDDGEIAVSNAESTLLFDKRGNIITKFGDSFVYLSKKNIASELVADKYVNTSASLKISGEIKRDLRTKVKISDVDVDKLSSIDYDSKLSIIGRDPTKTVTYITSNAGGTVQSSADKIFRNPAFVENREVFYEYSRDYQVSYISNNPEESIESTRYKNDGTKIDLVQSDRRDLSRANILNLNPIAYNSLIEKVYGNLVDRYGNVLDLNRNVISYTTLVSDASIYLQDPPQYQEQFLRRAIKLHLEINSRKKIDKEFVYNSVNSVEEKYIGHTHSRWSIDVDGEGLTKINIPSSSDNGNIPLLTRYSNTSLAAKNNTTSFRSENNIDVLHLAFGNKESGIDLPSEYSPEDKGDRFTGEKIKYRTAYHDIVNTASDLFEDNQKALNTNLSNSFSGFSNAGGRSLHANLDGSLELNIGRDNIDGKSIIVDTSGGIISRVGRDNKNNSVVSQLDGNIKIKIGGDHIESQEKHKQPTVKIYIESVVPDEDGYCETSNTNTRVDIIEVNCQGIFIRGAINKDIVVHSQANLVFKAEKDVLVHGKSIFMYGDYNEEKRTIQGARLLQRSGKAIP